MKIASWNVNSIKARTEHVQTWLKSSQVDVLCMQELKGEVFPHEAFDGYHTRAHGQKAYNGVATLTREAVEEHDIPQLHDEARIISVNYKGIEIVNCYMPNGNPVGTEKFDKKMNWTRGLIAHIKTLLAAEKDFIILGDFNIIPEAIDAKNPKAWEGDALFLPETRALYREMIWLGLTDAWRALHPNEQAFTFWDYTGGSWERNNGIRIDHILLSPRLADRLIDCVIDPTPRGWDKASDHTPIVVTLTD